MLLAYLFGTLFYKLKIRKLTIEDTPLEKIDDLLFRGVNRTLNELNIFNSKIKVFPKTAFKVRYILNLKRQTIANLTHLSFIQILGNLTLLRLDNHVISSLDNDIFFESLANEKLERLHLTNGQLGDLLVESFQVCLREFGCFSFEVCAASLNVCSIQDPAKAENSRFAWKQIDGAEAQSVQKSS